MNPTLTKNMKHVKWNLIPPVKGPEPRALIKESKQDKPRNLENLNDKNRTWKLYSTKR
jgi:hypothetical protein